VLAPRRLRAALPATPVQTKGPFYPPELPLDRDADLVRVDGRGSPAKGTVAHVFGRLLAPDGTAMAGARVEIWQCDALGRYHHPADGGGLDPNFQGFGFTTTDDEGRWRFRTIEPVPYPGRTPHIHVQVLAPGWEPLITQFYIEGHRLNARDFVRRRLSEAEAARVTAPFDPAPDIEQGSVSAAFDIVMGATPRQE
jgi:protocatechuate 3,4-dioxygenase beta subunit